LQRSKKLCYVSSTAALGDLASNETIITEEIEWNPENRTVIMLFLNMVPKSLGQQEGLDVIIVNPGIIGPGFQEQGSGLLRKLLTDYGITPWERSIRVSDVVRM
jgi:nucleoside-diphosphate-sugar epimerase